MARLKPVHRSKALALLARGLDIPSVAGELQRRYHSEHSVEAVQKTYFPSRGLFSLTRFEGASRQEILDALKLVREQAAAHAERGREHMRRLHADPEFAAANAERGREHMRRLNADPVVRERRRARLVWFWDAYRARKNAEEWGKYRATRAASGDPASWEGGAIVPAEASAEDAALHDFLHGELARASTALSPLERRVVSEEFGLELPNAAEHAVHPSRREQTLKRALDKLRRDDRLKRLFSD